MLCSVQEKKLVLIHLQQMSLAAALSVVGVAGHIQFATLGSLTLKVGNLGLNG
jgi:hypothetical protein